MGNIHTKLRNRLGVQRVRDTAVLRGELKKEHVRLGLTRGRLRKKRHFGELDKNDFPCAAVAPTADDRADEDVVAELEQNQGLDEEDGDDEDGSPAHQTPEISHSLPKTSSTLPQQTSALILMAKTSCQK